MKGLPPFHVFRGLLAINRATTILGMSGMLAPVGTDIPHRPAPIRNGWMDGWMDTLSAESLLTGIFVCRMDIGNAIG